MLCEYVIWTYVVSYTVSFGLGNNLQMSELGYRTSGCSCNTLTISRIVNTIGIRRYTEYEVVMSPPRRKAPMYLFILYSVRSTHIGTFILRGGTWRLLGLTTAKLIRSTEVRRYTEYFVRLHVYDGVRSIACTEWVPREVPLGIAVLVLVKRSTCTCNVLRRYSVRTVEKKAVVRSRVSLRVGTATSAL